VATIGRLAANDAPPRIEQPTWSVEPMTPTEPDTLEEVETETRTGLAPPHNVIVHDDPITLMSYVTMTLQRIFGFSHEKAQALMMEVHTHGRSLVWTGAREQAETYVQMLHSAHLLATLEKA
jgi:ATP-dependent Clp protease adaptor protein ClpS